MAACVVGRVRDCVRWFLTKGMLQLYELNFGCHREFRVWYLGRVWWPRGELRASVSRAGLRVGST